MRIVFFGTPSFAVPSLRALLEEGFDIVGVVTQPDRPQGRSRSRSVPSPVKLAAEAEGLPLLQPERPTGDVFIRGLEHLRPDIGVVVAYGHILRPEVLAIPPGGMINVHASLLPRYRGPAPIQWAILNGDETTGVSIMQVEEGLDTGAVLHRIETEIAADETGGELAERLAELGAAALVEALTLIASGASQPEPQDNTRATYAPKIDHGITRLAWTDDAAHLARSIRAFDPEPGCWSLLNGTEIKLFGARAVSGNTRESPGTVLRASPCLEIAANVGAVEVQEVQPAGKKRMSVGAWVRGRGVAVGQRFA